MNPTPPDWAFSLHPIKRKLTLIYHHYLCEEAGPLTEKYWSRSLRDTAADVLDHYGVGKECVNVLRAPCKDNWLKALTRKKIREELVKCFAEKDGKRWVPPQATQPSEHMWPELENPMDLTSDPFQPKLRDDVVDYLVEGLGAKRNNGVIMIGFNPRDSHPIVLYCTSAEAAERWTMLLLGKSREMETDSDTPAGLCKAVVHHKKASGRPLCPHCHPRQLKPRKMANGLNSTTGMDSLLVEKGLSTLAKPFLPL